MAILDKVEVRIKSAGEFLTEYDNPDEGGANDGSTATKFIEAKSGAQFSIEISVKRGYHFWGGDCLLVGRHMDGHRGNCSMIDKPGTFRDQVIFEVEHSIEHHMTLNAGQWRQNYFTFAELEMLEHSELPGGVDLPSYKQLGTITVDVRRAIAKKLPVPEQFPDSRIPSSIHQASEKMLKGRAIESSVKYIAGPTVSLPTMRTHRYEYLEGAKGTPLVFHFHYRSHNALQILGCIPRNPSPPIRIEDTPEPEAGQTLGRKNKENTQATLCQRAQERQTLQAELARLDRLDQLDRGAKTGPDHDKPSVLPNLKRNRDSDGVPVKPEDSVSRKRARASGPIEIVDLTED